MSAEQRHLASVPQAGTLAGTQEGSYGISRLFELADEGWQLAGLLGVLGLSAFLNLWHLSQNGYGNCYYAATVRSMTQSWHSFFFASFDPGGFITVDKPPVSVRRFESLILGKFLIAGGISYLVNQMVLVILDEGLYRSHTMASTPLGPVNTSLMVSSLVALEASIQVRFALNDRWTFRRRSRKPYGCRFIESNLSSFGSPIISLAAINILTPWLGITYLVANSIGIFWV